MNLVTGLTDWWEKESYLLSTFLHCLNFSLVTVLLYQNPNQNKQTNWTEPGGSDTWVW